MSVLVDTSVWGDFLNGSRTSEADELQRLIEKDADVCTCGVVVAEVFQGLRRDPARWRIQQAFEALTFLEPRAMSSYLRAADVYRTLRSRGRTIRSTIDCLIAIVAEENGCAVLSRDRDFTTLIDSGLVRAAAWPRPATQR